MNLNEMIKVAHKCEQAGNLKQALNVYMKILEIHPDSVDVLCSLGVIAYQLNNHNLAIKLFKRVSEIAQNNPLAQNKLVNALEKIRMIPKEKYYFQSSHSVVKDFSEFSCLTMDEIEHNINNFLQLTKTEWNYITSDKFSEKACEFYNNSKYYIYDLLSANYNMEVIINKLNSFNPLIFDSIKNHHGKAFLEFGGGLGVFCEIVARLGKEVTYLDIPGQAFDFAIWRFKKYNIPIDVICSDPCNLKLEKSFDIIFSDGVLEHVINPEEVTYKLSTCLNKDGLLILLVDLFAHPEEIPMHRDINICSIHDIIKNNGLENISGKDTFCSVWRKN